MPAIRKSLLLFGDSNTGKSIVTNLARAIVGPENTCQIPLEKMGDARNLAPIFGKMMNLVSEIKHGAMVDDGGFKQLVSTQEPVLIDEKYRSAFSYVPTAKHVFATNNLPNITDKSAATFNRLLIVQFNRVVPVAHQNPRLLDELKAELPGIIGWCLIGAKRLTDRAGVFTEVPESSDLLDEYRYESNHPAIFLAEQCTKGEEYRVPVGDFLKAYNEWVPSTQSRMGRSTFGRAMTQLGVEKYRTGTERYYVGICPTSMAYQTKYNVQGRSNFEVVNGGDG